MEAVNIKEEARRLIEKLPDDATWGDVMHELSAHQAVTERRSDVVSQIDDLRERLFAKYGEMPDSVELLREDRDR